MKFPVRDIVGNMVVNKFSLWLVPLLIASIVLNIFLLFKNINLPQGITVIGVIDGDTLVLEGKSKVRLRYVDAPEKGLCGYDQASKELERLVTGKSVRIEETVPDTYGRGMALVYTGNTLINKEMVASGWVRYHHDVSPVTDQVKQADETARAQKLGIYGACQSTQNTDNPKCTVKGNIDKSTNTHIYYVPGCAQYSFTIVEEDIGEQWFCSESEARGAGYIKAKTCK
ncbi:hypothetical protein A3A63_03455 [Candidatus Gottesmanbacteria bacterium RIFCSPLOWO2_01_FULL_46_9]|uniref:TNase-like domain-containing protein n=1 Tax=Candidatus Gottesmanbacteria bacterium RIFCSPLOWO2_01_FULL_46_9 TaxID=1798394 RepID=A0A1F6B3X7_9BACT|nr:MAG: hypothetical protein A3A63_03455 [Candidatus Gottesmanbacteria bacterium RIFCSPLOWO2_01_FULL_46_9]